MIDYRKIFNSKKSRMALLTYMSWMPDKLLLRIQYYLQKGKKLNLKNPKTFNEKIQAYKLFYRDPLMLRCTDKIEVRKYIEEKGLGHLLVPLIDIKNNWREVNLQDYPKEFVVKTSDGSGANEVIICRDKLKDSEKIKSAIEQWGNFRKPRKHIAREWAYDNGYPRKIIVEELLKSPDGKNEIDDFKFYCYQGKFKFLQWHKDRHSNHKAGHYDERGKFLSDICVDTYPTFDSAVPVPDNFNEMIKIAEKLAEDFPFVRVDLYTVGSKIYFGELTFYPASGYFNYKPEYVDEWLGSFLQFPFKIPVSRKKIV